MGLVRYSNLRHTCMSRIQVSCFELSHCAGPGSRGPFKGGSYAYIQQLEAIDHCVPDKECMSPLDLKYAKITTPFKSEVWEEYLQGLPNRHCAEYLVRGIKDSNLDLTTKITSAEVPKRICSQQLLTPA